MMVMVKEICDGGDGGCSRDAECEVSYPETGQQRFLCRAHGRNEEAVALRIGLTIVIEWFTRGEP